MSSYYCFIFIMRVKYSWSSEFPHTSENGPVSFLRKAAGILVGIALCFQATLGRMPS